MLRYKLTGVPLQVIQRSSNWVANVAKLRFTPIYIRQTEALGLGHAVLCAEPVIGDEPFAVILADDLIDDAEGNGCLSQMVEQYEASGASLLGVQRVPKEHTDRYGIVDAPSHYHRASVVCRAL